MKLWRVLSALRTCINKIIDAIVKYLFTTNLVGSLDTAKRNPGFRATDPGLRFAVSRLQALRTCQN
jgi:hypothetical protein